MKNSKLNRGKIGLMENSINDDERKNFAAAVARRDAERCGDIPVACTPAVAAVEPVRGELEEY